jgi:ABC-type Fe3+-hydroxamate transport system substrate-binding protein
MSVVYVAGPFRAKTPWEIEQNVRRAEEVSLWLWTNGITNICPHTLTRFFQHSASDDIWLEGTLKLMRLCDLVVVLPNYAHSVGTLGEIAEATKLGIPVVYLDTTELPSLNEWKDIEFVKEKL